MALLKPVVLSLDEVAEPLRQYYTEKEGKFVLDVDGGVVGKDKLDEFRSNNVKLMKEIEGLKAQVEKYKDIDPDKARTALGKLQEIEDGKLMSEGKIEELLVKRTERMKLDFDNQMTAKQKALETATNERQSLEGQLSKLLIEGKIREVATKNGVRPEAIEDVLLRGSRVWQLREGKATPLNGDQIVYGKSGDQLTMEEWVGGLQAEAAHLFQTSTGGGAKGGGGAVKAPGVISRRDQSAMNANIEGIASGAVRTSE